MSENKEKKTQNKKPGRIRKSFSSRQFKSGAYSSVITVIVIALVVIVNLVFNKLDSFDRSDIGQLIYADQRVTEGFEGCQG